MHYNQPKCFTMAIIYSLLVVGCLGEVNAGIFSKPANKGKFCDCCMQGPPGSAGIPGVPGYHGERGLIGPPGEKGEPGDNGRQGPAGRDGIQGVPGNSGASGEKGERGARGRKGDPGEAGMQGMPGIPGMQGRKGDKAETVLIKPDRVAFTVVRNQKLGPVTQNTVVTFNQIITNEGGAFEADSSHFVCRSNGTYILQAHIVGEAPGTIAYIMLNKVHKVPMLGDASKDSQGGLATGANMVILQLNTGDRVWLELLAGGALRNEYTTMSGWQLWSNDEVKTPSDKPTTQQSDKNSRAVITRSRRYESPERAVRRREATLLTDNPYSYSAQLRTAAASANDRTIIYG